LGGKMAFYGGESFTPINYLNSSTRALQTSRYRSNNQVFNWNLENTLSYTRDFDKHSVTVLLGQGSYKDNNSSGTNVTYFNVPATNFDDASMNYNVPTADRSAGAYEGAIHTVSSLFARLNYTYDEKYLFTAVIRRDGSSRFGSDNKYGYFPSFSVGWVASKEAFWPQNSLVDFFKLRGGYGVVGNDNIGDFAYLATIGSGRNYTIGNDATYVVGYSPNAPSNPGLRWEETTQINFGFEATVAQDVTVSLDWFRKQTDDILQNPRIPGYVGAISNPAANVGSMRNEGVELELGYRKQFGDLSFGINGNVSYIKNEITFLGNGIEFLSGGQTIQNGTYPITRTAVGHPINAFYGFTRLGIFQTEADVQNHKNSEGTVIQPNAKPGDFIWKDLNDDGIIDELDRKFIGNPTPTWGYGATLNLGYKNFDFTIFGQGAAGNKIFQGLRRLDVLYANWQSKAMGRWTGPGTSNDFPRMIDGDPNKNFSNPSDFYLEDGSYFRIKVVQLGYTLPNAVLSKVSLQKARIYVMAENLVTFTKYTGFDPEIGDGVMSIDRGFYPQARSFMVGLQVGF
jgi:TonB-linked SusC/RagA family outer membrane protein